MADRPILFSAPMVRALIDGRKTMTRRILKPQPEGAREVYNDGNAPMWVFSGGGEVHDMVPIPLRFAKGDRLYVREHWRTESRAYDDLPPSEMDADYPVIYAADADWSTNKTVGRFRQGMHMPRWASRLTLTVTDVRVERLQAISEADALAEGVVQHRDGYFEVPGVRHPNKDFGALARVTAREMYAALWDVINGSGAWLADPWIVATTFEVALRNIDA